MNKLITMCLLIIGLVVTGCGSASNTGSLDNVVISSVTPDSVNSTINSSNTVSNGIRVSLYGTNFGNEAGTIVYNPSSTTSTGIHSVEISSEGDSCFSWSNNLINFTLLDTTRAIYPSGSFTVTNERGNQSTTPIYDFSGNGNLSNATVTSVSPTTIYSYNTNQGYITIDGSGFGTTPMDMMITPITVIPRLFQNLKYTTGTILRLLCHCQSMTCLTVLLPTLLCLSNR